MNVLGTVTTKSPCPIPAAMSAKRSASVPLLTPTQSLTPQNAANSFSKESIIGPPINPAVSSAAVKTSTKSSRSSRCGATRSKNEIRLSSLILAFPIVFSLSFSQNTRRVSRDDRTRRNTLGHYAPGAHDRSLTHGHLREDRRPRSDRSAFLDQSGLNLPILFSL